MNGEDAASIGSRDYWFVDFLQQSWALVHETAAGATIWFAGETQFNSAVVTRKLWGDHTMHIQSKTAADLSKSFNTQEGGGEVVFRHNTKFIVTKADPKTKEIWMEAL
jgi:hypothetical protein